MKPSRTSSVRLNENKNVRDMRGLMAKITMKTIPVVEARNVMATTHAPRPRSRERPMTVAQASGSRIREISPKLKNNLVPV